MGLKGGSSAGLGCLEIVEIVEAFEQANSVRIELRAELASFLGKRDMVWTASAFERSIDRGGQLPLAYANVRCGEKRLARVEAVVLQLLYALDFQIAQHEFASTIIKRA